MQDGVTALRFNGVTPHPSNTAWLTCQVSNSSLHEIFQSWRCCWVHCIKSQGNWFEGDNVDVKLSIVVMEE